MKTYKLLMDIPSFPAGTLFCNDGEDDQEFFSGQLESGYDDIEPIIFTQHTINTHSAWFKEV